jgi:hypothetical protein
MPLSLDDKRWADLWCRNGTAENIPKLIGYLLDHPEDAAEFDHLNDAACSDGTTWSAGFAATPYMVEMARRLPPAQRLNILTTIGWIVTAACLESNDVHYQLETYLADGYYEAVRDCLPLLAETLLCEQKASDIVGILFSAAAFKGHTKLAEVLANLDSCPHCSEILERT